MALTPGTRLGPYEITAQIGVGGMGEVYRATDTKLKRDVAIKVLPEAVASDPDRLARFQREAEVLASLNHPGIAQIHGLEDSDGQTALVMELVEGPTLADRIAQGPIPIDDALPIAKQIAEALEAAHEQGIIHRDLKPANIKLRADGTVKVLDFGLAKAMEPVGGASSTVSMSPTITTPAMTQAGLILGTAAYMSPEQARGKPVDKRADVWAFGCVVYEMLAGHRCFDEEDISATLGAVIHKHPEWSRLPALDPTLTSFLRQCLQKDLRQRLPDIGVMRLALGGGFASATLESASADSVEPPTWKRYAPWAAGIVLAAAAGVAGWSLSPRDEAPVARFGVSDIAINIGRPAGSIALLEDGSGVVFLQGTTATDSQLHLRPLDALDATPLPGTEVAEAPFVSPDGEWVGFVTVSDLTWKRVSIRGGAPLTLWPAPGASRGATWGTDGTIVFADSRASVGLLRGPASGGTPEVLTMADPDNGEIDHWWPEFLPGGDAVLFTVVKNLGTMDIAVLDVATGEWRTLIEGGSRPHFSATGHILFGRTETLWAVPFDVDRLAVAGTPVPVVDGVHADENGMIDFDLSANGTLMYVRGGVTPVFGTRRLLWVDREEGREEAIPMEAGDYSTPRLSPDGTRVLVDDNGAGGAWLWDLAGETRSRVITATDADSPIWTSDGTTVIFESDRNFYAGQASGVGSAELLVESPGTPDSASPRPGFLFDSDRRLVFDDRATVANGRDNVGMVVLGDATEPVWILNDSFMERNAVLSPNGRWMAYQADESGEFEVFVRPFPNVDDDKVQVSAAGGSRPLWSRDGTELFYLEPGDSVPRLVAVAVNADGDSFSVGARGVVLDWPYQVPVLGRGYDVAPDGRRFLAVSVNQGNESTASLVVVQNFFTELERLVPTGN